MKDYRILLHRILTEHFNAEELRTLCFELDIDYDDLPGRGKAAKARDLVAYLEQRKRIPDCIEIGKRLRPDILWEEAQLVWLEMTQEEASDPRRFQSLIEGPQATVSNWEGRVERQRERITRGLEEERQKHLEKQSRRHDRKRVRVVGQPPLAERASDYYRKGSVIACEIENRWRKSQHLVGLGRALLSMNALSEAQQACTEALALDIESFDYLAALTLGFVLLRQGSSDASKLFADSFKCCQAALGQTAGLYRDRYSLAATLTGQGERQWLGSCGQ